tara:strand:- start:848 stop:2149 length:1302 start_codon:yes stop_codon:yes gene_type:complete
MKKIIQIILYAFTLSMVFYACANEDPVSSDDGDSGTTGGGETSSAPEVYEFYDGDGNSTVVYSGQVVRNLLITDIKALVSDDPSLLLGMYTNSETNQERAITSLSDISTVQTTYGDISSSNLSGKIAATGDGFGIDDCTVAGYDMEPDELINAWFTAASSGAYSEDGLDIGQMVQKGLMGLVSYYQGTSKYLGLVLDQNNTDLDGDNYYTKMEHYWDESFGYFGASSDYLGRTDTEIKAAYHNDINGDGVIDFLSENCTGISINAAKRDDGSNDMYNFTGTIMGAYLEGRHLISTGGSDGEISAQRQIIVDNWEMLLAANAIHYINDTTDDIGDGSDWDGTETASCTADTPLCQDYSKHYSEMRGFAMGLAYNKYKAISDSDLADVYTLMGTAPVWIGTAGPEATLAFKADLLEARDILQAAYGFDPDVVAAW